MKSSYKLALLSAMTLAGVTAVQAYPSGDLLLGVYDPSVANTEVYDIGSLASLGSSDTISLGSAFSGAGFNSSFSGGTVFGVFGATSFGNGTIAHTVYESSDNILPNTIADYPTFQTIETPIVTMYNHPIQGVNSGVDFSSEVTLGTGGLADQLGYDPAAPVSDTADLYSVVDNGGAPTLVGTFTVSPSAETLTYTAVPEPTTLGLLGGAGLLILSFRKKISRK